MIKIIDHLNEEHKRDAYKVLTDSFLNDPLFKSIFENAREINAYARMSIEYYNKIGKIHTAYDEDGRLVGLALWNPPYSPVLSSKNLMKHGLLNEYLRFINIVYVQSVYKLMREYLKTEREHYNGEHYYLFMIGSVMHGAGSALMKFALDQFNDCPVYLENSNVSANRKFYEKLGFRVVGKINVFGIDVEPMMNSIPAYSN